MNPSSQSKDGNDLNFTEIDPIPMKNVGRGPLGRGEAGVKVGDDDFGQMTKKSNEKKFSHETRSSSLERLQDHQRLLIFVCFIVM